jgi:hypothetical protein
MRSTCIIAAGLEIIHALGGFEDFGAGFESVQQARDGSFGDLTQKGFQLGEGFLDGVQVGAVGRQIFQRGSSRFDEFLDPGSRVARQIVHDDDVAFGERGREAFFHPFLERGGVHGFVVSLLRHEAAQAQAGDKRDILIVAVRDADAQSPAAPASAALARHLRGRPGLIDEHEFGRIEIELAVEPLLASLQDVRALLLLGMRRFF